MKRTTLLIVVLAFSAIILSSPARASSPVIADQAVSLSGVFSRYFLFFLRTCNPECAEKVQVLPANNNHDARLGGDADSEADGKADLIDDLIDTGNSKPQKSTLM